MFFCHFNDPDSNTNPLIMSIVFQIKEAAAKAIHDLYKIEILSHELLVSETKSEFEGVPENGLVKWKVCPVTVLTITLSITSSVHPVSAARSCILVPCSAKAVAKVAPPVFFKNVLLPMAEFQSAPPAG